MGKRGRDAIRAERPTHILLPEGEWEAVSRGERFCSELPFRPEGHIISTFYVINPGEKAGSTQPISLRVAFLPPDKRSSIE